MMMLPVLSSIPCIGSVSLLFGIKFLLPVFGLITFVDLMHPVLDLLLRLTLKVRLVTHSLVIVILFDIGKVLMDYSWDQYLHWLSFTLNQKLCVLELGVGFAHPNLIRFPFEKTVYFNKKARYIRVSEKFPQLSAEIADRGEAVKEDPVTLFVK